MRRRLLLALSAAAFLVYHVRHSLNSPSDDWSSIRVAASMVARGRLDLLYTMSFLHQDQPYADGQKGASLQVRRMCQRRCQCHVAGPAPSSRNRSRQRLAAALTSGADRTLRAGADYW